MKRLALTLETCRGNKTRFYMLCSMHVSKFEGYNVKYMLTLVAVVKFCGVPGNI